LKKDLKKYILEDFNNIMPRMLQEVIHRERGPPPSIKCS
jgi:hypothetical protein